MIVYCVTRDVNSLQHVERKILCYAVYWELHNELLPLSFVFYMDLFRDLYALE